MKEIYSKSQNLPKTESFPTPSLPKRRPGRVLFRRPIALGITLPLAVALAKAPCPTPEAGGLFLERAGCSYTVKA